MICPISLNLKIENQKSPLYICGLNLNYGTTEFYSVIVSEQVSKMPGRKTILWKEFLEPEEKPEDA
jgi:hypothetical protein